MLTKGKRVTYGTGHAFGDVVMRLGEDTYTMTPKEAQRLSGLLRDAIMRIQEPAREIVCIGCLRPLDDEDVVWFDPERNRLSTDTGHPYCVSCCPDESIDAMLNNQRD